MKWTMNAKISLNARFRFVSSPNVLAHVVTAKNVLTVIFELFPNPKFEILQLVRRRSSFPMFSFHIVLVLSDLYPLFWLLTNFLTVFSNSAFFFYFQLFSHSFLWKRRASRGCIIERMINWLCGPEICLVGHIDRWAFWNFCFKFWKEYSISILLLHSSY